ALEIGHLAHAPVRELSGGERQRVAVARLLVQRPQLILADEPTASIDARSATLVLDALQGLAHDCGATLLLATHDTDVARRLERVVGLAHGRLVLDASASGLAERALHAVYDGAPELAGDAQR
ncbi:MAG: ATP-binding cassette domain-containing protein, partial [Solirubrobacterales bacterium]|nr:ATP-binding cassette domain-containing protein [Solirubrobacterales bacterium]